MADFEEQIEPLGIDQYEVENLKTWIARTIRKDREDFREKVREVLK